MRWKARPTEMQALSLQPPALRAALSPRPDENSNVLPPLPIPRVALPVRDFHVTLRVTKLFPAGRRSHDRFPDIPPRQRFSPSQKLHEYTRMSRML